MTMRLIPGTRVTVSQVVAELADGADVVRIAGDLEIDSASIVYALRSLSDELAGRPIPGARDPRVDPIRGDVLVGRDGGVALVTTALGEVPSPPVVGVGVQIAFVGLYQERAYRCDLAVWRKWADGATVLRRGEDLRLPELESVPREEEEA